MSRPTPRILSLMMLAPALCLGLIGCGGESGSQGVALQDLDEPRVVTLAPALTQMLVDLGKKDLLVGVGENDFAAPPGVPVVGNFQNVSGEALAAVKPTIVLTMGADATVPGHLQSLSRSLNFDVVCYKFPTNILDIGRILLYDREFETDADPNIPKSIAVVLGLYHQAHKLKYSELMRLADLGALPYPTRRPLVLMVLTTNPVVAVGKDTVHDDVLGYAGGLNVLGLEADMGPAPTLDREMILKLRPEVILLLSPKDQPLGTLDSDARLAAFRGLDIPAVQNQRIHLIDDPLALLPSTSIVKIGAQMAKAIYPDMTGQIDEVMSGDPLAKAAARERGHDAESDAVSPNDQH